MVHQDAKVVAEERARDAKRPRRAHDERLARDEEHRGHERVERSGEQRYARLLEERAEVSGIRGGTSPESKDGIGRGGKENAQMIAQYPRAENAQGEKVAAQTGVAAEKAGDGLVAIFF